MCEFVFQVRLRALRDHPIMPPQGQASNGVEVAIGLDGDWVVLLRALAGGICDGKPPAHRPDPVMIGAAFALIPSAIPTSSRETL